MNELLKMNANVWEKNVSQVAEKKKYFLTCKTKMSMNKWKKSVRIAAYVIPLSNEFIIKEQQNNDAVKNQTLIFRFKLFQQSQNNFQ